MLLRVIAALDLPWAVAPAMLARMNRIVDAHLEEDIEAVATRLGQPLANTERVQMRGSTAVIPVEGPIFKKANLMTDFSGATSVESLATDFQSALDNPNVNHILLNIDSEGGQVDSIMEFADIVREGSAQKPVTAFIGNLGASGAYWIASAAQRVVMSRAAFAGSIGVVANIRDNRQAQEKQGVRNWEIVSSVSPLKRPDPATDEGRAQILNVVDSLGNLFVEQVARFRGVSTDKVKSDFGRGALVPAGQAVSAGMADEISNFEPLVARLAAGSSARAYISVKETTMAEPTTNPVPVAAAPEPAAAPTAPLPPVAAAPAPPPPMSERQRMLAVMRCDEARGLEESASILALETDVSVDLCRRIMAAVPPGRRANPLDAAMQGTNPRVGPNSGQEDNSPQAEAQRILAFVPKERRARAINE